MGTLEAAVWSMIRPAYAFGWYWRVYVEAPAGCGYCESWDPWRAVRSFGAWASKVGQSRHNMGTLEAAVRSILRPAYAFGCVWRVHVFVTCVESVLGGCDVRC